MSEGGSKIKVLFYSGYKGEETPRAVLVGNREYPVDEIFWRSKILDHASGRELETFACRVAGKTIIIKQDESGEWVVLPPGILSSLPE
ncbi:MAG: hypothetical protein QHH14_07600 [Clostridiales bacterium]|nr:hypothetical protein [Clostridiales bacterium]